MIERNDNAYEAMGYGSPVAMKEKAQLTYELACAMECQKLSQREAAEKMGIDELQLNGILLGHFRDLSVEEMQALVHKVLAA